MSVCVHVTGLPSNSIVQIDGCALRQSLLCTDWRDPSCAQIPVGEGPSTRRLPYRHRYVTVSTTWLGEVDALVRLTDPPIPCLILQPGLTWTKMGCLCCCCDIAWHRPVHDAGSACLASDEMSELLADQIIAHEQCVEQFCKDILKCHEGLTSPSSELGAVITHRIWRQPCTLAL